MKEAENSGAKQREGPITAWLHRTPVSLTLPSPSKRFICELIKFWEFSMMLYMERRKLSGQMIIFFQNIKDTSGWEKLVTPGNRIELTLREVQGSCQAYRIQSPMGSLARKEQTFQSGNWHGTRHCTKISGERAETNQTVSHLIPCHSLRLNVNRRQNS